jgi:hypothetical protein
MDRITKFYCFGLSIDIIMQVHIQVRFSVFKAIGQTSCAAGWVCFLLLPGSDKPRGFPGFHPPGFCFEISLSALC